MTSSERWELGLFLSLLIVGFLCLTAILNLDSLPRVFALRTDSLSADNAVTSAAPAPAGQPVVMAPVVPIPANVAPSALPMSAESAAVTPVAPKINDRPVPEAKTVTKRPAPEIKIYKGEKYRYVKTLKLRVTAYAPDARCCWPYPGTTTASGLSVKTNGGRLVASDPSIIPLHSLVSVPGYAGGNAVPVLDTGGAIKGHRLDVLLPTFDVAKEWGTHTLDVKIYMPVEDE
jgi:3D (Asp-Asp-Asp) domain-containing protein